MKKNFLVMIIGIIFGMALLLPIPIMAIPLSILQESAASIAEGYKYIAMALSTGISSLAAGYAVAKTGTAAIASFSEKPELFGKTIIFVGLAEGIAIYGLLISFILWII
ncbi:MAG: ATP synthase subunit C [Candidatus Njordarchaeia archaeon]